MRCKEFRIALTLNSILETIYEKNGQLFVEHGYSDSRLATNLRYILLGSMSQYACLKGTLEVSSGSAWALAAKLCVSCIDNLRLVHSYG